MPYIVEKNKASSKSLVKCHTKDLYLKPFITYLRFRENISGQMMHSDEIKYWRPILPNKEKKIDQNTVKRISRTNVPSVGSVYSRSTSLSYRSTPVANARSCNVKISALDSGGNK